MNKKIQFMLISIFVVFLDQLSKYITSSKLDLYESVAVIEGFFSFTRMHNKGIAFGMFANLSESLRLVFLVLITSLILIVVIYKLWDEYSKNIFSLTALAMIFGGAIGNLYDRAFVGYVVDFLDFYYGNYHWPAFNIADSAICVGVFVLIAFDLFFKAKKDKEVIESV